MMKYIDTSVFVSALVPEENSAVALRWLAMLKAEDVAISPWVTVELSGALARKLRMGRITQLERDDALYEFEDAWLNIAAIMPIGSEQFQLARYICDEYSAGIRSGDAVHLAVAALSKLPLCTFDKAFAAGAKALGYDVELIE